MTAARFDLPAGPALRRLVMQGQGLLDRPARQATADLVHRLGFVQVDSIRWLERAHDMIAFARDPTHRPDGFRRSLEVERSLFEGWTHDAALIPMPLFPFWRHRFARRRAGLATGLATGLARWQGEGFQDVLDDIRNRLAREGPLRTRDVAGGTRGVAGAARRPAGDWWDWHVGKRALDYLWHTGDVMVTGRDGFQKIYDLTERVVPPALLDRRVDRTALLAWACQTALDRLSFATPRQIAGFWGAVTTGEAAAWCAARSDLVPVRLHGKPAGYGVGDLAARLAHTASPPRQIRILSPFDPMLRDRTRTARVFGFDFRIEIFVPAAKRRYGYYIFPVLAGDRLIGRLDARADRANDRLTVRACWPEPGCRLNMRLFEAALDRLRRFAGLGCLTLMAGWLRDPGSGKPA